MEIAVLLKQVPDLVEELAIHENQQQLDNSWMKYILSEYDDHALEQALLLKESHGGSVHVFAIDAGEVDESLFNALAKGADSVTKINVGSDNTLDAHHTARSFCEVLKQTHFDLILTGVQAIDELDGQVGSLLSAELDLPYVGVIRGIEPDFDKNAVRVRKEFPGGMLAELSIQLPAVLGIQAATQPPRYIPVAKLRQVMKNAQITGVDVPSLFGDPSPFDIAIRRMYKPESASHAEIISGSIEEIVEKLKTLIWKN